MHRKKIITSGNKIESAEKAIIMIHGRGAMPADILSLGNYLNIKDFALLAPEATNYSWYPFSFMASIEQNEPWLTSSVDLIGEIVNDLLSKGIKQENIYFLGFSQGACLTLEFVTRNAKRWGGVIAFTGGLIGDRVYKELYKGSFQGTPVFIGTSDPDNHVPVDRVKETAEVMKNLNANVTVEIYKDMGHTIIEEEIEKANELVLKTKVMNA